MLYDSVPHGGSVSCRIKELRGARPHNQSDAETAAGMGKPDNGVRLQPMQMEQ